ncbi:MAG: hypothetical protein BJ554DRAFT_968 [Olpidium bornovanus]|uniref:Uncharacterized protein n=1 Tax=Olpidium bornovanus TaxID=278681 RepID=A0A8H8DI66_9FUNG|nr:MAG: hypothetical protein BJ554DRAFT_968 [Olpidium bornovanus]KAG5458753.1 MAG: hypothetical protein BJ554DRAFT_968 [Olpidium bornovanus]
MVPRACLLPSCGRSPCAFLYGRRCFRTRGYRLLPTGLPGVPKRQRGSFFQNVQHGLTSDTFDVRANLADSGDIRPGLDADDVQRIMKRYHCSFDQARLIQVQERMR